MLRLYTVDSRWRKYDHGALVEWYKEKWKHSDNNASRRNRSQIRNVFTTDPVSYSTHGGNYYFGVGENRSIATHLATAES